MLLAPARSVTILKKFLTPGRSRGAGTPPVADTPTDTFQVAGQLVHLLVVVGQLVHLVVVAGQLVHLVVVVGQLVHLVVVVGQLVHLVVAARGTRSRCTRRPWSRWPSPPGGLPSVDSSIPLFTGTHTPPCFTPCPTPCLIPVHHVPHHPPHHVPRQHPHQCTMPLWCQLPVVFQIDC